MTIWGYLIIMIFSPDGGSAIEAIAMQTEQACHLGAMKAEALIPPKPTYDIVLTDCIASDDVDRA